MNRVLGKKTALCALVILLACFIALFAYACSGEVSVALSLNGEIYPGATLSAELDFRGDKGAVGKYSDESWVLTVLEGAEIASIEEGRVHIAATAKEGDKFTLKIVVGSLSATKTFTVGKAPLDSVRVICPEQAQAGDVIELSAEVLPESEEYDPVFTLLSGDATLEGNVLTISERADFGEVTLCVTVNGVRSDTARIAITTVQTQDLYLTLSSHRALPGGKVYFAVTKQPEASSFPVEYSLTKGAEIASLDAEHGILTLSSEAAMDAEIELTARSGGVVKSETVTVGYPEAQSILTQGGGIATVGANKRFDYSLEPEDADRSKVAISVLEDGGEYLSEWSRDARGVSFTIREDAPIGAEITFLLETSEDVYKTVSFTVGEKQLTSLFIEATGSASYLKSGQSLTFAHHAEPEGSQQEVSYFVKSGADLVTVNGNSVTVKDGVGMGSVTVVAESEDGTLSNEVTFTVAGRYSRRAYSSWANVSLSRGGENSSIWMVLPSAMNAGCLTVVVPAEVEDLVIEGRYDGSEQSVYQDLYFYFRNAESRTVTLWNFATAATQGLGGTVFDLGTAGSTEIVLWGENYIRADSPYRLDNSGEIVDGTWNSSSDPQKVVRRSGKPGYVGTSGGTAVSGYSLSFVGEGNLTAIAGSGVNGTVGGAGADAEYDGRSIAYIAGSGGDGGHGGDSGCAIRASRLFFGAGSVTALPGNAGKGALGGAAGSLAAVVGKSDSLIEGSAGLKGKDGVPYPAICADVLSGSGYVSSVGSVVSRETVYNGVLTNLVEKLSRFYGVGIYYGTAIAGQSGFTMTQQTDYSALMQQSNFLMYVASRMPKNCWREITFLSGKQVSVYLCKSIKSKSGSTILGLTSERNNVWFATFDTEIRGVYYGGYFNIMLHEFVHVFHYNFTSSVRTSFETKLQSMNYGLKYISSYNSSERVYGLSGYDETDSCFLSRYSRKTVMEDTAETLSMVASFLSFEPPLTAGCTIRKKYDYLVEVFGKEYETLSPFGAGSLLFGYPYLTE